MRGFPGRFRFRFPGWAAVVLLLLALTGPVLHPPAPVHAQETGPQDDNQDGGRLQRWLQSLYRAEDEVGHRSGDYYTLLDEEGRRVTRTALAPGVGDTYIDEENRLYEVVRVDGRLAFVEFREVVALPDVGSPRERGAAGARIHGGGPSGDGGGLGRWLAQMRRGGEGGADQNPPVAVIYHSHNAESYVPTSGSDFSEDGPGDVHRVGMTLRDALEQEGMTVHWSQRLHLPHDGGAYRRSRATVRQYLSRRPVTMLDVHRDAIPAEEYRTEVDGQPMTKVRLVVGRQNQNREANLQYAKEIKAIADRDYPGLIKGIFHARGNYNQDVGPRMILLEFGTHETSLEAAQASARLMAKVIPQALGAAGQARVGSSAWRTAGWLLAAAILGVLAYLRINAGSWEAFGARLRQLLRLPPKVGNE